MTKCNKTDIFRFFSPVRNAIRFTRRSPPRPLTISSTPKLGNPVARHGSYLRPHAEFDGARRLVRCPNEWASWLCQKDAQKVLMSLVTDFSLKKALKSGSSPTPSSKRYVPIAHRWAIGNIRLSTYVWYGSNSEHKGEKSIYRFVFFNTIPPHILSPSV